MLYFYQIDVSKSIDINKANLFKEFIIFLIS